AFGDKSKVLAGLKLQTKYIRRWGIARGELVGCRDVIGHNFYGVGKLFIETAYGEHLGGIPKQLEPEIKVVDIGGHQVQIAQKHHPGQQIWDLYYGKLLETGPCRGPRIGNPEVRIVPEFIDQVDRWEKIQFINGLFIPIDDAARSVLSRKMGGELFSPKPQDRPEFVRNPECIGQIAGNGVLVGIEGVGRLGVAADIGAGAVVHRPDVLSGQNGIGVPIEAAGGEIEKGDIVVVDGKVPLFITVQSSKFQLGPVPEKLIIFGKIQFGHGIDLFQ